MPIGGGRTLKKEIWGEGLRSGEEIFNKSLKVWKGQEDDFNRRVFGFYEQIRPEVKQGQREEVGDLNLDTKCLGARKRLIHPPRHFVLYLSPRLRHRRIAEWFPLIVRSSLGLHLFDPFNPSQPSDPGESSHSMLPDRTFVYSHP
jgi:hypothetical protein